jgi:hypothetical protein
VGERASQQVSNGGKESNTSGKEGRDTKGVSHNKCDIDIGSVMVREKTEREIESEGERERRVKHLMKGEEKMFGIKCDR